MLQFINICWSSSADVKSSSADVKSSSADVKSSSAPGQEQERFLKA